MEAAENLMNRLFDCRRLERVLGAAHAPNMTHPEIVNEAMGAFSAKSALLKGRPHINRPGSHSSVPLDGSGSLG